MIISRLLKHKVHMARPITMPLQQLQQFTHRPIVRDRVWHGHNGLEPKYALLITTHHRSLIWTFTARVLYVVEAFAVCFPYVDFDILNGLAVRVFDVAEDEAGFSVRVVCDFGAIGRGLGFVGVEGAEDGAFRAVGGFRVVDAVYEEGEAEDV